MTDEEIKIAVAEACGWKLVEWSAGLSREQADQACFPDYANDLNAVSKAKRALLTTPELQEEFKRRLYEVFARKNGFRDGAQVLVEKTAADESEALLRTIGKWKD